MLNYHLTNYVPQTDRPQRHPGGGGYSFNEKPSPPPVPPAIIYQEKIKDLYTYKEV